MEWRFVVVFDSVARSTCWQGLVTDEGGASERKSARRVSEGSVNHSGPDDALPAVDDVACVALRVSTTSGECRTIPSQS